MQTKTKIYTTLGLLVACLLMSSYLDTSTVSATSVTITTNNNITLNASAANNGVTIDEESIGITTTCNKGYDLTIATSTSTNLYLNGDSTGTAAYTAVDGASALDSTNNTNKWGYTTTSNATSSTIFSPLSTTASSIRTIAQTTDITSETIPIYYGIKTDNTVDPGTYSMSDNGTIIYYLTMNPQCSITNIVYDGNNADEGTISAVYENIKDGDTVNLIANNYSREGYGFAGWSTDPDAGTKLIDNDNTNNPIVYGPQETVILPEGFTDLDTDHDGIVKLYAVWIQSRGDLQGWMGCSSLDITTYDGTTGALDLTKNSVTALTDQRDDDTYAVARLADGQCWMIENLRLDNDAAHNSDGTLAQSYGVSATYGNFAGLADPESTGFAETYSANSLYSNDGSNGTINIGASDFPVFRMPRYNNVNTSNRTSDPTSNNNSLYAYGNYYSWHAAIADLNYYGINNQSTTSTSICPAGWHLPKGGGKAILEGAHDNEFWNLTVDALNGGISPANYSSISYPFYDGATEAGPVVNKLISYPNNFVYSGYYGPSTTNDLGNYGCYWSATAASADGNDRSFSLTLEDNSYVYPGTRNNGKVYGRSVRCVASEPTNYTLSYDPNSGTDAPASQTTTANGFATYTLSATTPTRSGYTFVSWTDQEGNEYQPGGTFVTRSQNATLYAKWAYNYAIAYDINTTDTNAEGAMGNQTKDDSDADLTEGHQVTLLASNFSRTGYGFAGWSLDPNAATSASAKIYGPQETIIAPSYDYYGNNGLVTLYAVWVQSAGSIQDASTVSSVCNSLTTAPIDGTATISSVSALTDQRDNETYAIAKLADGECWMIENLRLETDNTSTPEKQALAQGYGASTTYGDFSGLANSESANFSNSITANSLYYSGNQTGTATINIGTTDFPAYRMPRYSNLNTGSRASSPNTNGVSMYSYGNYYTWPAAMANTIYYDNPTSQDIDGKTSETVNTSLCPTGWRLPYGRDTDNGTGIGGFYNLNYKINNDTNVSDSTAILKLLSFPNNFLRAGLLTGSSAAARGNFGGYWSSTTFSYLAAYGLDFDTSTMSPGNGNSSKYYGYSIRCTTGS